MPESLAQVFSCEFCKISENIFFNRTRSVATSVFCRGLCAMRTSQRMISSFTSNRFIYMNSGKFLTRIKLNVDAYFFES